MKTEGVCMAGINPSSRLVRGIPAKPSKTQIAELCERLEKGGEIITDSALAPGKRCRT